MIKELHEKLIKKKKTSLELVKEYLDKIKNDNKRLNAFLDIYEKEALEVAKKVDKKISQGEEISLLEGIPCAIKDNICLVGKKTTAGSKILENYTSPYDATVMSQLKKENPIILGKTNMDEFAMGSSTENSAFGVTRNPIDESRVSGGSSGGSAAVVAANMAVWALGSDTGGSIRQPASLCGIVGLKPTYGRVSRSGLIAMGSSYDQIGPLAKSVEDAAIILDHISGNDPKDNTTIKREKFAFFENLSGDVKGKKVGFLKEFFSDGLSEVVRKVIEEKIEQLKKAGVEIVEIDLPYIKYSLGVYYLMVTSEISSNMARYDGIKYGFNKSEKDILETYFNSRKEAIGAEVKRRIILGTYALSAGYYDAYYKKTQRVRELIKKDFQKAFDKVDVILSPTSPTTAFKIGEKTENPLEMYLSDVYTVPANVAGIPAISVSVGFEEKGDRQLPVGVQVMGKWWDEQIVLDFGKALENP